MIVASSPPGETAASSDSTSFGRANETPGTSGPKPSHFAGCPVDRERPERAAVEAALEGDDPRPTRRLARDLERRLVRLGARVAEERLRAAEPSGEERREPEHRLRPVEVRGVPELVELRVRSGGDRRVPMAEADDGDAGAEVQVRALGVVPHTAALSPNDRDVSARVRRQHRRAGRERHRVAHAGTSVDPMDARTPPRAACTAAISFGTMPPSNRPSARPASASSADSTVASSPSSEHAGDVGDEQDPLGAEAHRERRRSLVRVDVERSGLQAAQRPGRARPPAPRPPREALKARAHPRGRGRSPGAPAGRSRPRTARPHPHRSRGRPPRSRPRAPPGRRRAPPRSSPAVRRRTSARSRAAPSRR